MSDPFEDILGTETPPPRRGPGRPTREEAAAKLLQQQVNLRSAASGHGLDDVGGIQSLRRPVTTNTLAKLFEHDVQTITRRLVDCPYTTQGNRRLYDFKEAAAYIVKPRMTPEQFIKTLNKANLPPEINLAFWNAARARLKYKIESQEAWETEDVLRVLGDVFMTLKDSLTTITEEMRERAKLTDDQVKMLEVAIDELRESLREKLVEMPKQHRTTSVLEQPLFGTSKELAPGDLSDWDAEDE